MTVLYNFSFELLVTNLLLKNFKFAQYAFMQRDILSLTSHFMLRKPPPENRAVYEIMWKNMVE